MTNKREVVDQKKVLVGNPALVDDNEEKVVVDDPAALEPDNPRDSYEGRKNDAEIDGPQQASQETDEIYADPRKEENLPDGGKNVGDLNAQNLSQKGNEK